MTSLRSARGWAVLWLASCGLVAGCAAAPQRASSETADSKPATDSLYTDLIRGMLAQGQYYAALAHIEEETKRRGAGAELTALRADALSSLGRSAEAEALYRSLLSGSRKGEGYHGLGLLYARRDPSTALSWLRAAVREQPTNPEWRNDLGFALTASGRYREALPELATATELNPASEKYRNNLAILLILMKDEAALRRLAKQTGLEAARLAELRRQAQTVPKPPPPKPAPQPRPATPARTAP